MVGDEKGEDSEVSWTKRTLTKTLQKTQVKSLSRDVIILRNLSEGKWIASLEQAIWLVTKKVKILRYLGEKRTLSQDLQLMISSARNKTHCLPH